MSMTANKHKQSELKFDQNWRYSSEDTFDIDVINNGCTNDRVHWIPIQLPHLIDQTEEDIDDTTTKTIHNWWYSKQFQWKDSLENDHQRVSLVFESLQSDDINEENLDYPTADHVIIWLNGIQICSTSFKVGKTFVDLTEQLIFKRTSDQTSVRNTLIIRCKNGPLSFHVSLLVPHAMSSSIEEDDCDLSSTKNIPEVLPVRKNRVLDYLVGFNDTDGRFDIGFNSILKSPKISKSPNSPYIIERKPMDNISVSSEHHILDNLVKMFHPSDSSHTDCNTPNIIVSEDDNQSERDNESFHVPRLTIVMLVVGTRGDVQPFIA